MWTDEANLPRRGWRGALALSILLHAGLAVLLCRAQGQAAHGRDGDVTEQSFCVVEEDATGQGATSAQSSSLPATQPRRLRGTSDGPPGARLVGASFGNAGPDDAPSAAGASDK